MKTVLQSLAIGLLAWGLLLTRASAQLAIVDNDGSDGNLVISGNRVINLAEAVTGAWNANNTANAGKGVYDPEKWAVVFKYESVTINEGATVTFANHPSHAPVVWLVKGNVTINGVVSLDGAGGSRGTASFGTEPGPGGFRGNAVGTIGEGSGFGPPGGRYWQHRSVYGNPQSVPLIGGSGASTGFAFTGGGGGGAILIAAEGRITIGAVGAISAKGGGNNSQDAAGGAIRLVANELVGTGTLNAGPEGIVRLEANVAAQQRFSKIPDTQAYLPGNPAQIWPAADAPTARIVQINGLQVPADPLARIDDGSDVRVETAAPVDVIIETKNFPITGKVVLRIGPKFAPASEFAAERIEGNQALAKWRVSRVLATGFSVLQVRAFVPRG